MPGTSFDRVAQIYDETRGGQRRGTNFAASISPWIVDAPVVELGVGTGVVARGLADDGHNVIGFDLSEAMMLAAQDRLGQRIGVADVDVLPLADNAIATAFFVWVLQLVDDPAETLREAARVVRPGGRVIAILSNADDHPEDKIAATLSQLAAVRRPGRGIDPVLADAPHNLMLEHSGFTPWDEFSSMPSEQADLIEARGYSSLFDIDDATFESTVVPVIEELRSMPDADKPQTRCNRHPLIVWTVTD